MAQFKKQNEERNKQWDEKLEWYFDVKFETQYTMNLYPFRYDSEKDYADMRYGMKSHNMKFVEKFKQYMQNNMVPDPRKPIPEEGQPVKLVVRAFPNWDWSLLPVRGNNHNAYVLSKLLNEFWTNGKFDRDALSILEVDIDNVEEERGLATAIEISKIIIKG